jgi:hypothetical protein
MAFDFIAICILKGVRNKSKQTFFFTFVHTYALSECIKVNITWGKNLWMKRRSLIENSVVEEVELTVCPIMEAENA